VAEEKEPGGRAHAGAVTDLSRAISGAMLLYSDLSSIH